MTYTRSTYTLRRFEIVAPCERNDGEPSGYPLALRQALADAGFTGWTETDTCGYWLGAVEPGVTFTIFAPDTFDAVSPIGASAPTEVVLAAIGRSIMTDQDAIQVVRGEEVTLTEG